MDLIVEWLGLTWGDMESQGDAVWMCMEPNDLIATNYSVFRLARLKKKECTKRCAKYLHAHGFLGPDWKGCKQKVSVSLASSVLFKYSHLFVLLLVLLDRTVRIEISGSRGVA